MKTKLITPEELFTGMKSWFTHKRKVTFFSAFLYGILIYFGAYSKGLTNPDGLWNSVMKVSGEWELSLGRFMLPIIDIIRGDAIANVLYSVITIGILSLAIVWLIEFVKSDSSFWNGCIAIFLMSNQLIGTIITYYYCSIAYAVGFAAAVYAVRLCCLEQEKRFGRWRPMTIIKGMICIVISLGCYQSYIGVAAFLILWMLFSLLFRKDMTWKKFGTEFLQAVILFAGGVTGYWLGMKGSLKLAGITLADYKNANAIGMMEALKELPESMIEAYKTFGNYYFSNILQINGKLVMLSYLCLFILAGIVGLIWFVRRYKETPKKTDFIFRTILAVVFLALIPVAANMVLIAVPNTSMILLMSSGLLVVMPIITLTLEAQLKNWKMPLQSLAKWGVCIVLILLVRNNILVENTTQLALEEIRNRTYTMSVRILEQIEKTPGYENGMKVCINASPDDFPMTEEFSRGSWIVKEGAFWEDYEGTYKPWQKFFAHELGVTVEFVSEEECGQIMESLEFQNLNTFPQDGCTAIIDNVVVMKVTNTSAN